MPYRLAPIILKSSEKKSNIIGDVYISQPPSDIEELAGKFFIIIEIEEKSGDDLKILNFLVENLEHNYYQNEKLILRERVKTIKIDHIFEISLAKTNKSFAEYVQANKLNFNPDSLNILTGVIHEEGIYFTTLGKNKAFLIFKDKQAIAAKEKNFVHLNEIKYKAVNIIEKTGHGSEKKPFNITKIFSSVISGSIPAGGYFVFTNEALSEYLSVNQLTSIASTLPPMSAVEQIKNTLSQINSYVSFFGIIIKNTAGINEQEPRASSITPRSTNDSMTNLNRVESGTEKLLAPGGYINFKKWGLVLADFFSNLVGLFNISKKNSLNQSGLRDRIFFKKRPNFILLKNIWNFIANTFFLFLNFLIYLFKFLTNKDAVTSGIKNIGTNTVNALLNAKNFFLNSWLWAYKLSLKNKLLLLITIASIAILIINSTIIEKRNEVAKKAQEIENITKEIKQKQTQIEANSLYNNEEGLKKLLAETKELLDKLPSDQNQNDNAAYQAFMEKYNAQLAKLRHILKIENPIIVADFSKTNINAKPQNIIMKDDKIYSGDEIAKTIYIVNTKNTERIATITSEKITTLKSPSQDNNGNILYLNNGKIFSLSAKGKIDNFDLNVPTDNVIGLSVFNNKLYLLDSKQNQIIKLNRDKNSFSGNTNWLGEPANFSNATSLDIDGSLYVLFDNGIVVKYAKGQKENFTIDEVDPKLNSATKIIANDEKKFVYILNSSDNRIIVFTKEGKFLLQYQSDMLNNIKDLVVDEKNKAIYILNNTSIYKFTGSHFEMK